MIPAILFIASTASTILLVLGLTLGIIGLSGAVLFWPEQSAEVAPRCNDCDSPMWATPGRWTGKRYAGNEPRCRNVFCPGMREEKNVG